MIKLIVDKSHRELGMDIYDNKEFIGFVKVFETINLGNHGVVFITYMDLHGEINLKFCNKFEMEIQNFKEKQNE